MLTNSFSRDWHDDHFNNPQVNIYCLMMNSIVIVMTMVCLTRDKGIEKWQAVKIAYYVPVTSGLTSITDLPLADVYGCLKSSTNRNFGTRRVKKQNRLFWLVVTNNDKMLGCYISLHNSYICVLRSFCIKCFLDIDLFIIPFFHHWQKLTKKPA